jgi:hypothetical protein
MKHLSSHPVSSHSATRSRAIKLLERLPLAILCTCGAVANNPPAFAQEPVVLQEQAATPPIASNEAPVAARETPAIDQPPTKSEPEASIKTPEDISNDISNDPPEIPIPAFSDTPGVYVSPGEQELSPRDPDQGGSDVTSSAPAVQVGKYRFQTPASKDYIVQRARAESAARAAFLERYRKAGWNYGQPSIDSNVWYSLRTTNRYKNFFVVPMRPVIE